MASVHERTGVWCGVVWCGVVLHAVASNGVLWCGVVSPLAVLSEFGMYRVVALCLLPTPDFGTYSSLLPDTHV